MRHTGDAASVYGRVFATHAVENATPNADGSVRRASLEYKPGNWSLGTDIHKNYGMDLPVGGIGRVGVDGRPILPSGQNGHAYMKLMPGGDRTCGAMLFGIESSAPGKSSLLGQAHNRKAVKSKQSPFLSHKQQAGDLYSGRTVDFSQMDGQSFINLMGSFDSYYRTLQNDPSRQDELRSLNTTLCGMPMGPEQLKELLADKLKLEPAQAETVFTQLRRDHVPPQERVHLPEPEKPPERPNIFKRWFSGFNAAWREQNERYLDYVRRQQTARLLQRSALDDEIRGIPAGWSKGEKTTLREYVDKYAKLTQNTETEYDREWAAALTLLAVKHATAANPAAKASDLPDAMITPGAMDLKQAMKDPLLTYLQVNRRAQLREAIGQKDPCGALLSEIKEVGKRFAVTPEDMKQKQADLKALYDELNVPDLESRSPEYQEMVESVGKLALREKPNMLDSISVFNSVQNYANRKSDVPSSELGKKSLSLAYRALRTALPEGERGAELMQPLQRKMAKLEQAMTPKVRNVSAKATGQHML